MVDEDVAVAGHAAPIMVHYSVDPIVEPVGVVVRADDKVGLTTNSLTPPSAAATQRSQPSGGDVKAVRALVPPLHKLPWISRRTE